jgi:hypothetical protein
MITRRGFIAAIAALPFVKAIPAKSDYVPALLCPGEFVINKERIRGMQANKVIMDEYSTLVINGAGVVRLR